MLSYYLNQPLPSSSPLDPGWTLQRKLKSRLHADISSNRYHSDAALSTMGAYRIGRKPAGPWANMTPPTRRAAHPKHPEVTAAVLESSDSDTEVDDGSSLASSECSCDYRSLASSVCSCEVPIHNLRRRVPHGDTPTDEDEPALKRSQSRAQYTDERVQNHAGVDAEQYPSVDPVVQEEIVRKYRALHQQVRDDGLYDCPYLDYGKEALRYAALFAAFLVALRYGQYLVSAVFLGLFWVSFSGDPRRESCAY